MNRNGLMTPTVTSDGRKVAFIDLKKFDDKRWEQLKRAVKSEHLEICCAVLMSKPKEKKDEVL